MKRLCLLSILFLVCAINAQTSFKVYAELVGKGRETSAKRVITVDFGKGFKYWTRNAKDFLVDENGDKLSFNSMIDAMNYMSKRGWSLENVYINPKTNDLFWVISKEVISDEQIMDGLIIGDDLKSNQ